MKAITDAVALWTSGPGFVAVNVLYSQI
jgi:hypothetical protein